MTLDSYDAYARIMASAEDGIVCWWYAGTLTAHLEGMIDLPCVGSITLMACKVEHLTADSLRIDWIEPVLLRDLIGRTPVTSWPNPISGRVESIASCFLDGPVTYLVSREDDGLRLEITQRGARILAAGIECRLLGDRVVITQTEEKIRRFSQHAPDQAEGARLLTTLVATADRAELQEGRAPSLAAAGVYDARFDAMLTGWMDFAPLRGTSSVKGIIRKAGPADILDPEAWAIFQQRFPEFFENDRVSPREWRR